MWAADFFTVPTLALSTLCVFFVVSHDRRRIEHYYNATRPHRTLEFEPLHGPRSVQRNGKVVSIPVLGGIHHRSDRMAA